jgi:transcriptional regulator GlxA family with amidase domain
MIYHLVFDGVADGPLGVALEVVAAGERLARSGLSGAEARGPSLRQRVVSLSGEPVQSGAGRVVAVDGALSPRSLRAGDVVVLPGLGAATEGQVSCLLARPDLQASAPLLRRAVEKRVWVAASCSATFVLAAAGLLDAREATTTWCLRDSFCRRFPRVKLRSDRMVVESETVFTAGAALAHADLMLALLARTQSPSLAHWVARYLVLDERVSQARYLVFEHLRSADPTVRALESFVSANLERQVSLHEMARAVATSPRTLARRIKDALGTTPLAFVQRLRIGRAVHLLETTSDSVESVAARVGYADAAAFRRVFRRETGDAPRHARSLRQTRREISS